MSGNQYVVFPGYPAGVEAVGSIDALRRVLSNTLNNGDNRIVDGGTVSGDGQGGVFFFDSASVSADNGLTVVKPIDVGSTEPGRWRNIDTAAGGNTPDTIASILTSVSDIQASVSYWEGHFSDVQSASDSAYAAQDSELAAAASALDARISQAQNLPPDFAEGTKYWTDGEGQISASKIAANNPLQGSFVATDFGVAYQTIANPQSCGSFGPLGYIVAVPGSTIVSTIKFRAITDNTAASNNPEAGAGLIPLDSNFNLISYVPGTGVSATVADGWQTVTHTFTVPMSGGAPYYRPTFFYNVSGTTLNAIYPSNDIQGNQQFQVASFVTTVSTTASAPSSGGGGSTTPGTGGTVTIPVLVKYTAPGLTTYTTPANTTYLRVKLRAGGGGGAGGGAGAAVGGDGGSSSLAGYFVSGGKGGATAASNYARGGAGGASTGSAPSIATVGGVGQNAANGFTYAAGASGAGARAGKGGGFDPGQPGSDGCGGAGGGVDNTKSPGGGGGEGGEIEFIIANPSASYQITIGAGGAGGTTTDSEARPGGKGGDGSIVIEAH